MRYGNHGNRDAIDPNRSTVVGDAMTSKEEKKDNKQTSLMYTRFALFCCVVRSAFKHVYCCCFLRTLFTLIEHNQRDTFALDSSLLHFLRNG